MPYADVHCHLYDLPDLEERIARWKDAGLAWVLCASENRDTMERTLRLKGRHPEFIRAGLGLHPCEVTLHPDGVRAALEFMAAHLDEADMVGEAGLDYKTAETPEARAAQHAALEEQFRLAAGAGLGVNLHSRRALRETMEAAVRFRAETGLPALLHWFTHSRKLAARAAAGGVLVSAGPAVLGSEDSLRVAASVPADRIVLESDAPVPLAGVASDPAQVPAVAAALARAAGVPPEELASRVYANSCALVGRSPGPR